MIYCAVFSNFCTLCGTFLVISSRPFSIPKPMPTFSKSLQSWREEEYIFLMRQISWLMQTHISKMMWSPILVSGYPTQGFLVLFLLGQALKPDFLVLNCSTSIFYFSQHHFRPPLCMAVSWSYLRHLVYFCGKKIPFPRFFPCVFSSFFPPRLFLLFLCLFFLFASF